jgi:cyclohexanecarboxylate-CoA ligase
VIPSELEARYRIEQRWSDETLVHRFDSVCAAQGRRIAIVDGAARLTFEQTAEAVERVATWFARVAEPGGTISWVLPNWWEAIVVHHAAIRSGCTSNPLNPSWGARELRAVIEDVRPSILLVPERWRGVEHLELALTMQTDHKIPAVVVVRGEAPRYTFAFEHFLRTPSDRTAELPSDPAGAAVLLFTSGTTSSPKGVLHSHRGLLCEMDSFTEIHALTPDDRYLGGSPVNHIAGLVYGTMTPFALGTSTALIDRWDAPRALNVIEADRATFQTGPPTFLLSLASAAATADLASFRLFSTGGANIPTQAARDAAARLGCVLKRAYGSTEIPTLTATNMDDDERARTETDGHAIGGTELRIVDAHGEEVDAGRDGEIWGRAPEMFIGYRDRELDATTMTSDGWFRTGDLGTVDEHGLLRVTGRLKDIIIRGGENISAQELEDLLAAHPAIQEVAVIGVPDDRLGERVCAVVVVADGASLELGDAVDYLRARSIASHKLPERLETVDELPRTASGKVAKADLRKQLLG